jgi:hypothetical protein
MARTFTGFKTLKGIVNAALDVLAQFDVRGAGENMSIIGPQTLMHPWAGPHNLCQQAAYFEVFIPTQGFNQGAIGKFGYRAQSSSNVYWDAIRLFVL